MADGAAGALHKALIAALKASADVAAIVGPRVYDEPPQAAKPPYIRLGALEPRPLRTSCNAGERINFGLEAHSRPKSGRVEATKMLEAIKLVLDGRPDVLTLPGWNVVAVDWLTQTTGREDDGETYLGIAAFEALIERA
ncbi:MAG: DUF3168 domain-containing protein [Pseudomonadota bacterium]